MSDTVRVRVTGPQFRHAYEQYEEGDELEVPERTLEKHPASIERVGADDEADVDEDVQEDADAEDGDEYEIDPHPEDLTIAEIEDRIADVDDVGKIEAIKELEKARGEDDSRSGAVAVLDDRIDELEG